MSELLPCPFCGGAAKLSVYYDFYRVHCNNDDCIACLSVSDAYEGYGRWYKSISEAREAWNTRAERTCQDVNEEEDDFTCSACGASMFTQIDDTWVMIAQDGDDDDLIWKPNYCPNCGAKVVEP